MLKNIGWSLVLVHVVHHLTTELKTQLLSQIVNLMLVVKQQMIFLNFHQAEQISVIHSGLVQVVVASRKNH